MKKCPYCAEEIQEEAKKCKHCGEWFDKKNESKINNSTTDNKINVNNLKNTELDIRPWYKKRWLVFWIIFIGFFFFTGLYGYLTLPESNKTSNIKTDDSKVDKNGSKKKTTSSGNNVYFAGYPLGAALASQHSYFKGNAYIERECNGLVTNYIGKSSNSGGDYMFIRGCVNGYKEAFGKR